MMIDVLLVDDHPLFRKGLKSCLSLDDEINVVVEAANGKSAWVAQNPQNWFSINGH